MSDSILRKSLSTLINQNEENEEENLSHSHAQNSSI